MISLDICSWIIRGVLSLRHSRDHFPPKKQALLYAFLQNECIQYITLEAPQDSSFRLNLVSSPSKSRRLPQLSQNLPLSQEYCPVIFREAYKQQLL